MTKEYKKEFKIDWPDNILFSWESEIFAQHDNFEDYLFSIGVLSRRGGIKKPSEYRELTRKWNSLQYARVRRDEKNGFPVRKKWLKELGAKYQKLTESITPDFISKEAIDRAATPDEPNYTPEEEVARGVEIAKIPF